MRVDRSVGEKVGITRRGRADQPSALPFVGGTVSVMQRVEHAVNRLGLLVFVPMTHRLFEQHIPPQRVHHAGHVPQRIRHRDFMIVNVEPGRKRSRLAESAFKLVQIPQGVPTTPVILTVVGGGVAIATEIVRQPSQSGHPVRGIHEEEQLVDFCAGLIAVGEAPTQQTCRFSVALPCRGSIELSFG